MASPSLASLDFIPYLDDQGLLPEALQGKVGVYGVFDADQVLQYVGYSRNLYLSLQQHMVRQPQRCYWVKAYTIDRPDRPTLESMLEQWLAENGTVPLGNSSDRPLWTDPIDARGAMTTEEQAQYARTDDIGQTKLLKTAAKRLEEQILSQLKIRGLQVQIRFNPKLKDSGLLDLK